MDIVLFFFVCFTVCTTLNVIFAKNPVVGVFSLVLTFTNVACILFLLDLAFLSMMVLIVYVGAIAILWLFVIMMLNIKIITLADSIYNYIYLVILLCGYFFYLLFSLYKEMGFSLDSKLFIDDFMVLLNVEHIFLITLVGLVMYTYTIVSFFIATLILLIAMIGCIIIAFVEKKKVSNMQNFSQVLSSINFYS